MDTIRVLLVGLGGYGNGYVQAALDRAAEAGIALAGAVDPAPSGCTRLAELQQRVGTIYPTIDAFFEHNSADLVVISAPIHLHAPFTIAALTHGAHVLCEKPLAGSVQDALAMRAAEAVAPGTVSIGYQWSISETVRTIRRAVTSGRFGEPLELRTLVFWPRTRAYYDRSRWAGALKAADGSWVLDSPANNATAHYLHNMFFVLGPDGGKPASVQAELYRANTIENFDTAAMRVRTVSGATVWFGTSHAVPSNVGPVVHYRFSEADVYCEMPGNFYARYSDGMVQELGSPNGDHHEKLQRAASDIRAGRPPGCPIDDALHQTTAICAAQESSQIVDFPAMYARHNTDVAGAQTADTLTWVEGLQAAFTQCFGQGILPSEHGGIVWAQPGREIDTSSYTEYPSVP